VFAEFGELIAPGGAGPIISSVAGHMMQALLAEKDEASIHLALPSCSSYRFVFGREYRATVDALPSKRIARHS
jgi:hypothetical protein